MNFAYIRRAVQDPQITSFLLKSGILLHTPHLELSPLKNVFATSLYTKLTSAWHKKMPKLAPIRIRNIPFLHHSSRYNTIQLMGIMNNSTMVPSAITSPTFAASSRFEPLKSSNNSSTPSSSRYCRHHRPCSRPQKRKRRALARRHPISIFSPVNAVTTLPGTPASTMANPKSSTFFFPTPATGRRIQFRFRSMASCKHALPPPRSRCHFYDYHALFDGNLDLDALAGLALANKLIHTIRPQAFTIAEDVLVSPASVPQERRWMRLRFRPEQHS